MTATNVADRLWEQEKLRVDRRKLQMDTIKRIGRYSVPFEVFPEVVAELKLVVAPEGEELPPAEELAALEAQEAAEAAAAAAAAKPAAPEYLPEAEERTVTAAEAAEAAPLEPVADEPAADEPVPADEPADEPPADGEAEPV